MLHKYIAGERDEQGLDFSERDFFEKYAVEWKKGVRVEKVCPDAKEISLEGGEKVGQRHIRVVDAHQRHRRALGPRDCAVNEKHRRLRLVYEMCILGVGYERDLAGLRLLYLGETGDFYIFVTLHCASHHGGYHKRGYFHLCIRVFIRVLVRARPTTTRGAEPHGTFGHTLSCKIINFSRHNQI